MEEKDTNLELNKIEDEAINKQKEDDALQAFVLSIIGVSLWTSIIFIMLIANSFMSINQKLFILFIGVAWLGACVTGLVFGIISVKKAGRSDGVTTNPYKVFRVIAKITGIISIVLNSILTFYVFIFTLGINF